MEVNNDWNFGAGETNTEQLELKEQKDYEENIVFLRAFATPAGKQVLDWMVTHTLESPTWWPTQKPEFGYFREGQNSLVRQLQAKIKQAKQYQEKKK